MAKLYGLDLFVEGGNRSELITAVAAAYPKIPHIFFEDEEFDSYLKFLGIENLAVIYSSNPKTNQFWKVDIEMTEPVPSEQLARAMSRGSLLIARPKDEVAQYSAYIVYARGEFAYEAMLEDEDEIPWLRKI